MLRSMKDVAAESEARETWNMRHEDALSQMKVDQSPLKRPLIDPSAIAALVEGAAAASGSGSVGEAPQVHWSGFDDEGASTSVAPAPTPTPAWDSGLPPELHSRLLRLGERFDIDVPTHLGRFVETTFRNDDGTTTLRWRAEMLRGNVGPEDRKSGNHYIGGHATHLTAAAGILKTGLLLGSTWLPSPYFSATMNPKAFDEVLAVIAACFTSSYCEAGTVFEVEAYGEHQSRTSKKYTGGGTDWDQAQCALGFLCHHRSKHSSRYCAQSGFITLRAMWLQEGALASVDTAAAWPSDRTQEAD